MNKINWTEYFQEYT